MNGYAVGGQISNQANQIFNASKHIIRYRVSSLRLLSGQMQNTDSCMKHINKGQNRSTRIKQKALYITIPQPDTCCIRHN